MANIYDKNFNKNVVQVYTQEPGFTGFKGFEFDKIDDIEGILKDNMPSYDSVELYYDGLNNNTGVYYKKNGITTRLLSMNYDINNNLVGVIKLDY